MRVKALRRLLYRGAIYEEGAEFEMDECSAGIAQKYGNVEIFIEPVTAEVEAVEGLPPLNFKKQK